MIQESSGDIFQWLRGFYYVAVTESFSKAALEIGRSQSAVTIQVRNLENEFNLKLFDRSSTKVKLTHEGRKFFEKTILIFEIIDELRYLGQEEMSCLEGVISLATPYSVLQYYLPQCVADLKTNYPQIKVTISGCFNHEMLHKLDVGEADFGIYSPIESLEKYSHLKLFETQFVLIANKNEQFQFETGEITLDQIAKKTFVHYNQSSNLRKIIESKFMENGLNIHTHIEVNHFETIKRYVELGLGISIINSICLSESDNLRFRIIPMDRFFKKRIYYLINRKGKYISPPAQKLIESVIAHNTCSEFSLTK